MNALASALSNVSSTRHFQILKCGVNAAFEIFSVVWLIASPLCPLSPDS
jgi:hypothetical protein